MKQLIVKMKPQTKQEDRASFFHSVEACYEAIAGEPPPKGAIQVLNSEMAAQNAVIPFVKLNALMR